LYKKGLNMMLGLSKLDLLCPGGSFFSIFGLATHTHTPHEGIYIDIRICSVQ